MNKGIDLVPPSRIYLEIKWWAEWSGKIIGGIGAMGTLATIFSRLIKNET
jgi:hypothetical protein